MIERDIKGRFVKGHKTSKELKEKISEANKGKIPWDKGKKLSSEHIKKLSKSHKGIKHSEETKRKISESHKRRLKENPEAKIKLLKSLNFGQIGKNNPMWKSDKVSYSSIHKWIRYNYGNADHCEKCGSKNSKKYEWCNISGEYKRDINDYIQLCTSCHIKFHKQRRLRC